jgi:chromosome transmission fidelity protein 4
LLSEFDFEIPLSSKPSSNNKEAEDDENNPNEEDELKKLEGQFVLNSILTAQHQDLVENTKSTNTQRTTLARMELEIDKTLLQMMAVECREGEERGMRALEMVTLLRDRTGRMIEAAGKVADRYGRTVLGEKIREVGELRLGEDMDED